MLIFNVKITIRIYLTSIIVVNKKNKKNNNNICIRNTNTSCSLINGFMLIHLIFQNQPLKIAFLYFSNLQILYFIIKVLKKKFSYRYECVYIFIFMELTHYK